MTEAEVLLRDELWDTETSASCDRLRSVRTGTATPRLNA